MSAFAATVILMACTPKASPTATAPVAETKTTETGMPAVAGTLAADVAAGHTIFTTSCTKCHGEKTKYVTSHTYAEAIPVMNSMAKKARLTQEQINQLAAYVYSVSKK